MDDKYPLVSIGMPLYNADQYLREALDSLLAQDYPNFELIISDNASTDSTEAICREYAARDARVSYSRNEENIGAFRNQNKLMQMAGGKYFMLAAHDDLRAPSCVSECVAALEENPEAVFCCTQTVFIDQGGAVVPGYEQGHSTFGTPGLNRRQRVRAFLRKPGAYYGYYGLMRTSALRQTRPLQNVMGLDVVFLLEMSLMGPIIKLPRPLFFYRIFEDKTTESIMHAVNAAGGGQIGRPYTDTFRALLKTVRDAKLGSGEKLRLRYEVVVNCCFRNWIFRRMIGDENVRELRSAWKNRKLGKALSRLPYALLALPELIQRRRIINEQRLIESYQQRRVLASLWHLPLYLLLNPGNLARPEARRAVSRLFRGGANNHA